MNKYDLIKNELDWMHDIDGYCVSYEVTLWAEEWSTGRYWIVTGTLANGSIVNLGQFETYYSKYAWLADCVGVHTA